MGSKKFEINKSFVKLNRLDLLDIGFQESPTFTVGKIMSFELGRGRQLAVSCIGTPNEMVSIGYRENIKSHKVTDLIVLRNYDYDGYTSMDAIKQLIEILVTPGDFKVNR